MRIVFVSSLLDKWGGSEVTWCLAAKKALQENDTVFVSVYEQHQYHKNIEELRNNTVFQARANEMLIKQSSLLKRLLYKISKKKIEQKLVDQIQQFNPDKIVISLSNTFDFVWHSQIENICFAFPEKIILQSNFHSEHLILKIAEIEKIQSIVSKVDSFVFAAMRNKNRFEHQIAKNIEPCKYSILPASTNYIISSVKPLLNNHKRQTVFCMMSRFDLPLKGHDIVIEILSKEVWKERDWILHLYGDGNDLEYLKRLISYYNLESRIVFKGYSADLEKEWMSNDILLLPSIAEGTPIVLMIAMMCARPSVVTNIAGQADLIINGVNGFVANGPDVFSFSDALEEAWLCRENWSEIGLVARKTVENSLVSDPERVLYELLKS